MSSKEVWNGSVVAWSGRTIRAFCLWSEIRSRLSTTDHSTVDVDFSVLRKISAGAGTIGFDVFDVEVDRDSSDVDTRSHPLVFA